jgi:site-specific DNA-methyltransferase (cytosine-N4-specific)
MGKKMIEKAYKTNKGSTYNSSIEDFILSSNFNKLKGKVDLIVTSPPYPLIRPKAYGNLVGEEYKVWLSSIMNALKDLLKPGGSMIIEIGNAWDKGLPTMSTLPLETLISIKTLSGLHVCQQFIWNNTNKLPGPAIWVNIKKIRVKDSFTHIWWFSPTPYPSANNQKVLSPYGEGMKNLLKRQNYNTGTRPSGHVIGDGFLKENKGAIPSSVLSFTNSKEDPNYAKWCGENDVTQHPARMPERIVDFFINLTTEKGALVLDPFAGSNTTGKVAEDLGRRWVAIEKDKSYVLGSQGRFIGKLI